MNNGLGDSYGFYSEQISCIDDKNKNQKNQNKNSDDQNIIDIIAKNQTTIDKV